MPDSKEKDDVPEAFHVSEKAKVARMDRRVKALEKALTALTKRIEVIEKMAGIQQ